MVYEILLSMMLLYPKRGLTPLMLGFHLFALLILTPFIPLSLYPPHCIPLPLPLPSPFPLNPMFPLPRLQEFLPKLSLLKDEIMKLRSAIDAGREYEVPERHDPIYLMFDNDFHLGKWHSAHTIYPGCTHCDTL